LAIELVDPVEWAEVTQAVDGEFGEGMTKALLRNRVPVTMQKGEARRIFLVPMDWVNLLEEIKGFEIKSLGIFMGDLAKGRFRFSLQILMDLVKLTDHTIVVSERGAQAFTYGRSVLKQSVVKLQPGLMRGNRVLVLNEDGECLGIASLTIDSTRLNRLGRDKLVAKNLVDIGAYVRGA
jgi:ribosome biogenesis protein Nip4